MFSVLGELKWFFTKYKWRYSVAIIFLVAVGLLELLPPYLIGNTIDQLRQGYMTAASLTQVTWILIGVAVMFYGMTYIWMYQLNGGAYILERNYRTRLIEHLLKMTPGFYERYRKGDLMARTTNDLEAVGLTAGFGILTLVDSTFFMLSIILMMGFTISWELTIAAILPLPIMAFAIKYFGDLIEERYAAAQESFGTLNDQVLNSINGVRMIRAYVQESSELKRFEKLTDEVYQRNLDVTKLTALLEPIIKILISLSYMIGLGYGAFLVFHSELTLGELVSFNIYLGMLIWPMYALNELVNIMQRGKASINRVNEVLKEVPDVQTNKTDNMDLTSISAGNIDFDHYSFQYPLTDKKVLDNLTFTLKAGDMIGIVGKTGSGKSTLLKQLLREYPSGSGKITIAGNDIKEIHLEHLNRWIGYVPQDYYLFSTTIKENILFGKTDASDQEILDVVNIAALSEDLHRLHDGIETIIGEKGMTLSGGQKQRISIARALVADPEILILDDALSAVDAQTETSILRNLQSSRYRRTTLMATHRLSSVQHADYIIVLDDGSVSECGTHDQLIQQNGWYKEQFINQQLKAGTED